jgi:hypothetical protein
MKILLAALLLAPAMAPPAFAPPAVAPPGTKPFYRGHYSVTCASWRTARVGTSDEARLRLEVYRLWLVGYVTAFNLVGPDLTGDLMGKRPWEEVYAYIDRYCERHPSYELVDATQPLVIDFLERRPKPTGPPPGPKRKATVTMWTSCKEWTEDRGNAILRIAYGASVRGYLTAYNLWGPDPAGDIVGPVKDDFIDTWFDAWCLEQPRNALIGGMGPLIDHLRAERAAGRLPPGGRGPADTFSPGSREPR